MERQRVAPFRIDTRKTGASTADGLLRHQAQ
jgi:hypothetical protein